MPLLLCSFRFLFYLLFILLICFFVQREARHQEEEQRRAEEDRKRLEEQRRREFEEAQRKYGAPLE